MDELIISTFGSPGVESMLCTIPGTYTKLLLETISRG